MLEIHEVEQKLNFADYLLNRDPPFPEAALKHILQVANSLITRYLNLGNNAKISPQIACSKLADDPDTKEFAEQYLSLLRAAVKPAVLREEAENAFKATKEFFELVKRAHGSA